jgi:hypothetical protein
MRTRNLSRLAIAALAVITLASAGPALAQHAGGGGHGGGGGGGGGYHGGGVARGGGGNFHSAGGYRGYAGGYRGGYYGGYRGGYYGGWRGGYGYGWGGWYYGGAGWLGYGLLFASLPYAYSTYWWDGVPYYYADSNYYQWDSAANAYETVEPPTQVMSAASANGATVAPPAGAGPQSDLFAYPKNGQNAAQQAKDRTECQQWATGQTGTEPAKHPDYLRAEEACLTGRGYSVR